MMSNKKLLSIVILIIFIGNVKAAIPTFQELMNPDLFPNAQFGMEVLDTVADDSGVRIETTGSIMEIDYSDTISFSQKIGKDRVVLKVKVGSDIAKPTITHSGAGRVFAEFAKPKFDLRVNGDSLYMIHAKEPLRISLNPRFTPISDGNFDSNHLLLDEFGGFGVYCSVADLPNNFDKKSKQIAVYELPAGEVLWLGICPPKEYDWDKSINSNVIWHWSTVTSYPDDQTIDSWQPYADTVLFQGEIMLWKDWNLGFEPRLGIDQWNRVRKMLHKNGMKYMVYTSPSYYLKGTDHEEYAVNGFENFKGWPPFHARPFKGENIDLFLEDISKVMKELKPDGLYFDGQYRHNAAALYKLARSARKIVGDDGLLEWHSSTPFGVIKGKHLCYIPQVDAYADYILRGEFLEDRYKDEIYMRYFISGYNSSNSIGVFCSRDHAIVTDEFCNILFDNNIRLHLVAGKENLRIKKYSGWIYQQEPLERYVRLYLSKLKPELKERVNMLCQKRQSEFDKKIESEK